MREHSRVGRLMALLALAGCSSDGQAGSDFVLRDSLGVTIAENAPVEVGLCGLSGEPSVSIGTAEGPEAYQLYRVFGAARLTDGRIVLVNQGSQELRFYGSDGQHLMNAGREGEGPGEFRDAFYLWVLPGDTIWVGDYRPFQFLVFSPDGEWVRTVRPRPEYVNSPGVMSVLDDGRSVLGKRSRGGGEGPGFHLRHQPVVIHDADGRLADSVGTFPNGRWGQVGDDPRGPFLYPLFESFARVAARGTTIVTGHGSEPRLSVLKVRESAELDRIITWSADDREVAPSDVAAERDRLRSLYDGMDPAAVERLVAPLVSDARPVSDRFPVFTGLRIGRDGGIWIREYTDPGDTAQEWTSFDPAGRLDCSIRIEADEVLEFGADHVLALHRDDLGVERVLLYDIHRQDP